MVKKDVKLVAVDMDGTLLDSKKKSTGRFFGVGERT